MEVIRPGSAHILKQMLHSRNTLSPTSKTAPETFPPGPPVSNNKPQPSPRKRPDPHIHNRTLPAAVVPQPAKLLPPVPLTSSVEAPSTLPQDYVEPSLFPNKISPRSPIDPTVSLPVGMLSENGHTPPPLARRPNHTYSHKPRNHPQVISKSSSENSFPSQDYEVMDPGPELDEVPQPVAAPRPSKPKPKPRIRTNQKPPPTVTRRTQSTSSPTDDILEEDDDGGYLCLVDEKTTINKTPTSAENSVPSDVAEQLMKSFDKDQLGSLIHMLQQVHVQGQGLGRSDSPDQGPETSLRGSFSECGGGLMMSIILGIVAGISMAISL